MALRKISITTYESEILEHNALMTRYNVQNIMYCTTIHKGKQKFKMLKDVNVLKS